MQNDLNLERQLLRYVMDDPDLLVNMDSALFSGIAERRIFSVFKKKHVKMGPKVAKSFLLQQVPAGQREDVEFVLQSVIQAEKLKDRKSAEAALESLRDYSSLRSVETAMDLLAEAVESGNVDSAYEVMRGVVSRDQRRVFVGDYLEDYTLRKAIIKERSRELQGSLSDVIPTGMDQFDKDAGGIAKGEVAFLITDTGGGKSLSKLNFAVAAWLQGYNVVHFALEMTKEENEFRADSLLTGLSAKMFRLAKLGRSESKLWEDSMKYLRGKMKNYLKFGHAKGHSLMIDEILHLVETIEQEQGARCDLFVLDHILLVKRPRSEMMFEGLMHNMQALVDWAKARQIAVWTSGQVTDEGVGKKNRNAGNVKYGRALIELAQVGVSLEQSDISEISNEAVVSVFKGRSISRGKKYLVFPDFDRMLLDAVGFANILSRYDLPGLGGKKKGLKLGK